ncbi:tetratricopeptide repeat protein 5 [Lethenteron reissneri]|uniref:tetratricopeptide repeat protein 5 n=1 Tax=Lethenteron reissneri TaxID=7753 RepID=UPI002AB5E95B|nr:tetratricopeptide repeat protein 5 [Lethenteron reissneri]
MAATTIAAAVATGNAAAVATGNAAAVATGNAAAAVAMGDAAAAGEKSAMQRATEVVETLFAFRDRYFEQHGLDEAALKGSRVESRRTEALSLLAELEGLTGAGDRAGFLALRGRALNVVPDYEAEAEAALSRAVKLRPALVDAWNELGDVYWKKGDVAAATSCLEGALAHCRNKVSLRSLSMLLRQQPNSEQRQDPARLVMDSVAHAKDAVAMDTGDGTSWYILGNAYFSLFFVTAQDPRILQLSLNAYAQAEKVDTTASSNADLHLNRATLLQYRELYGEALDGFSKASALEPTWDEPQRRRSELLHFLRRLSALVASKGKVKPRKLQVYMKGLRDADLGPYAAGGRAASAAAAGAAAAGGTAAAAGAAAAGGTAAAAAAAGAAGGEGPGSRVVAMSPRALSELSEGANAGALLLGRVLFSVTTEHSLPFVFGLLDSQGSCCAVSVYNFVSGWGVLIGDTVVVPAPSLRTHHVQDGQQELTFQCVRVSSPASLVVNGRQQGNSKQAAVTACYSRKFT